MHIDEMKARRERWREECEVNPGMCRPGPQQKPAGN